MREPEDAQVIVIGAGAVGTSTALHLAERGIRVTVVEKESGPGLHQSARNSGVIHAGYNLKPGSAKAVFCVEGSRRLRAYCAKRGIPVREDGILVVARTDEEMAVIHELAERSALNGVAAHVVDEKGVRDVEPYARGVGGLHAPEGASFDARAFVHALQADAVSEGAHVLYDTRVTGIEEHADGVTVLTGKGALRARVVVNAAGLHADRVAQALAKDVRVVPFRGYYAELAPARRGLVRSHVYAAPDLSFPFLGVHLSRRVDGRVIVGPGAMLAFGREAYRFHHVQPADAWDTVTWPGFWKLFKDARFRGLVGSEVRKSLSLRAIWTEAQRLLPALKPEDVVKSYAGVRAQMVTRDGALVDDILVRSTERAVHVLNAVSPGLTCSLPFGEHLSELALERL